MAEKDKLLQPDPALSGRRSQRARGLRSVLRWLAAVVLVILAPPVLYIAAAIVGGLWGPPAAPLAASGRLVEIAVFWSPIHTDIVLPVSGVSVDWNSVFSGDRAPDGMPGAGYVAIGWGSETFYREVPVMADVTPGIVARALFFDRTVMHVTPLADPAVIPKAYRAILSLPEERVRALEQFVLASFRHDAAGAVGRIPGQSYGYGDAFYLAEGRYWPLRTCNQWTGEGLRLAGVPVGYWTPFSQSISWVLGVGNG